jgi:predicted ATPase
VDAPSDRLRLVTGAPGTGKSTLVAALAQAGVTTSEEVGRRVLREQLASGGDALPWADEAAFAALMLPGELAARTAALATGATVVLDRGVPDVVAFLAASDLPVPPALDAAARTRRYHRRAFLAPFWPAILVQDAERPRSAHYYARAHDAIIATYARYGYDLVELPRASVAERVRFVTDRL